MEKNPSWQTFFMFFCAVCKKKNISPWLFLVCPYLFIYLFLQLQTNKVSHNCCLHLHLPTNMVPPSHFQIGSQDSFSSLWALCARGSYCPGGDTGPEPWSCQGFRVPSHSLSQQQNSWGTKLHPKKAWSTPPRKTPQCRAVLLAVTPLTDLASSTTQPLLKDINHGSSYVLELQPHTGSLPVHM